ncbi:MAG: hypothetical protein QGG60_11860, partial [Anaerolineales bacterium]|nr:hypothetical protein [Anaerolineales bacterium]
MIAALLLAACAPWLRRDAPAEQPSSQPAAVTTLGAAEAVAGGGFALLPQKAQYIISGDIGKDQPAYHARPNGAGGFLIEMPEQDLRAELSAVQGWRMFTQGYEWGLQLTGWGFGD